MKKYIFVGIILALVLIVGMSSVYTVAENQCVCVFRFSEIVNTETQPGLHFKMPFVDSVKYFSRATQFYDIPPSDVTTLDKQNMTVDCYVLWRIEDPQKFYRTLGTASVAEDRLDGITYSVLKNTMGNLKQADIINENPGGERNEIYEGITTTVNSQAAVYGIVVEDVKIKRFDLPESNLNAVYTRMISERRQMAEKYTADGKYAASIIINDVDKQVNIIISNAKAKAAQLEAEGEAMYMQMLAEAYDTPEKQAFYEFILALDALKSSLTGNNKTVILDADSDLAKILMGTGN